MVCEIIVVLKTYLDAFRIADFLLLTIRRFLSCAREDMVVERSEITD
jgi:hypothetical protein